MTFTRRLGDWYPLNDGAVKYMAESMAMTSPYTDQEQNWILGHMVTFASPLYEALVMVRDADNDCRRDGLATIPQAARSRIDRALALAVGSTTKALKGGQS